MALSALWARAEGLCGPGGASPAGRFPQRKGDARFPRTPPPVLSVQRLGTRTGKTMDGLMISGG